MRARLALAAVVAALATAPLAPAHASACNKEMFPEVCAVLDAVCQRTRPVCSLFE